MALAATPGFQTEQIVLYQPHYVFDERMPDSSKLADYIKRLQDVCQRFFANTTKPETLDVVVAVRPGRQSRVWFVSSVQSAPDESRKSLRRDLEKVTPCSVTGGAIAFAIAARIAGGDGKQRKDIPMPIEWQRAAQRKTDIVIPDGILDAVWQRGR